MWCDVMWCDVMWCDVMWCDVMWCDVMWCDVMWCDVMWCDVMWMWWEVMRSDVMWCGVIGCNVSALWCDVLWCDVLWCDGLWVSYECAVCVLCVWRNVRQYLVLISGKLDDVWGLDIPVHDSFIVQICQAGAHRPVECWLIQCVYETRIYVQLRFTWKSWLSPCIRYLCTSGTHLYPCRPTQFRRGYNFRCVVFEVFQKSLKH
jgi:hypothetical protein